MTYEETIQRLQEMESRYNDGFSSLDRSYLDSLYFAFFGREITNKGCSDCYRDAYMEILIKLKKTKEMPKKSEYVLKPGAIITFFGEPKCYTNANITDEAALRFLSQNPRNESLFEALPRDWEKRVEKFVAGNDADSGKSEDSDKDTIISELRKENEQLKQELSAMKAGAKKPSKGKKKTVDDAPAPESAVEPTAGSGQSEEASDEVCIDDSEATAE